MEQRERWKVSELSRIAKQSKRSAKMLSSGEDAYSGGSNYEKQGTMLCKLCAKGKRCKNISSRLYENTNGRQW